MKPPDWTPENDSLLLKMHMERVPFEDIALRLGRSVTAVERRWTRIRPAGSIRKGKFQPSSTEMQDVKRLRLEGRTWSYITALMFPNRGEPQIRYTFKRGLGHQLGPATRRPIITLPGSETEVIQRLLEKKTTWKQIATLTHPNLDPMSVRRAYVRQTGLSSRDASPAFTIPSADIPGIKRMLETGSTWEQIASLTFPDMHSSSVRRAFVRQTGLRIRKPRSLMPAADVQDVKCMLEAGYTWKEVASSKYPGIQTRQVRTAFIQNGGRWTRTRRGEIFVPSTEESADVRRMLEAGSTWEEITTAKYPDKPIRQVRDSFRNRRKRRWTLDSDEVAEIQRLREAQNSWQQIATAKYPGKSSGQVRHAFAQHPDGRGRTGRAVFRISSADITKVQSLREAKTPWTSIVALMYPNTNVGTVRSDFIRQTDGRGRTYRKSASDVPSGDMSTIQQLQSRNKSWGQTKDTKHSEQSATRTGRDRAGKFDIASVDMLAIQRSRSEGKSWGQIQSMKYPDKSVTRVRAAFIRQDDSRSEEELRKRGKPTGPISEGGSRPPR